MIRNTSGAAAVEYALIAAAIGIAAVVDLAMNEPLAVLPRELVYLRFPIVDGAGNAPWLLRAAADAVASLMRAGVVTLIYCGAGMSRTPAIAAAGLAKAFQMPLDDALISVCDGAPADISSALWAEVRSTVNGAGD